MLRWPSRSIHAISKLFRSTQEIDIYVEDKDDAAMYSRLFGRILEDRPKVVRVFPLGNRSAVLKEARADRGGLRPRAYLVDGDFPWVRGEAEDLPDNVIRLDAYCIENLLFDGRAAHRVLSEEANIPDAEAESRLEFRQWEKELAVQLLPLAISMAILNQLSPDDPTISRLPGDVIEARKHDAVASLSNKKVRDLRARIRSRAIEAAKEAQVLEWEAALQARVSALSEPLRIVTGKDLLMALLEFRLRRLCKGGAKLRRRALRIRLAGEIELARAEELVASIRRLAR